MIENAPRWRQFLEKQGRVLADVQLYKKDLEIYRERERKRRFPSKPSSSRVPPSPPPPVVTRRIRNNEGKSVKRQITVDFETIPEIVQVVGRDWPAWPIIDPLYLTSCLSQKGADPDFMTADDINSINMIDVWHGCDPLNIADIKLNGFSRAKASATGLYGPGAYFASQACKALQYCSAIAGPDGDAETKLRERSCPKPVLEQRAEWIKHCSKADYVYKVGDAVLYKGKSARIIKVTRETRGGEKIYIYRIKFTMWDKTTTFWDHSGGENEADAYHDELWPDVRIYCITHSSVIMGATLPISGNLIGTNGYVPFQQCLTQKSANYATHNSVMAIGGLANEAAQIHHEFVSMDPEKFTYVSHVIWFTTN
jgi:hypothetical protein